MTRDEAIQLLTIMEYIKPEALEELSKYCISALSKPEVSVEEIAENLREFNIHRDYFIFTSIGMSEIKELAQALKDKYEVRER